MGKGLLVGESQTTPDVLHQLESSGYSWKSSLELFPCIEELREVKQDPLYHSEGDVYQHTRLVCQALTEMEQWEQLPAQSRALIYLAALFHDIGKKITTREEGGRIQSPKHTLRGEQLFRQLMYTGYDSPGSLPFEQREQVAALIRYHGLPVWFAEKSRPEKALLEAAERIPLRWLWMLAKADYRGKIRTGGHDVGSQVDYFGEYAEELGCLDGSYPFASDFSRTAYFNREGGWPGMDLYDDSRFEVVVMSGLPLSGKDTLIERELSELPVISLDEIREERGFPAGTNSAEAAAIGREQARKLLRRQQPFVWNATNLRADLRQRLLRLCTDYGARVRLLYLEAPWKELLRRNQVRGRSLPLWALERMVRTMELPQRWEAQSVEYLLYEEKDNT